MLNFKKDFIYLGISINYKVTKLLGIINSLSIREILKSIIIIIYDTLTDLMKL